MVSECESDRDSQNQISVKVYITTSGQDSVTQPYKILEVVKKNAPTARSWGWGRAYEIVGKMLSKDSKGQWKIWLLTLIRMGMLIRLLKALIS